MKKLTIKKDVYEGVTESPHFPVVIDYEGCHVEIEDLYFGNIRTLSDSILNWERLRTGEVHLDAGSRFSATLSLNSHGALVIRFRAEPTPFPGRLFLEGSFIIDGEYTGQYLMKFVKLINEGETLNIEQRHEGGP